MPQVLLSEGTMTTLSLYFMKPEAMSSLAGETPPSWLPWQLQAVWVIRAATFS